MRHPAPFRRRRGWCLSAAQIASVLLPAFLALTTAAQSTRDPSYAYRVLYDFCSLQHCTDGAAPWASLIEDGAGNLYGTTIYGGGSSGSGVVFKVNRNRKETVLYAFGGGSNGFGPYQAGLVRDSKGNLYGTTENGGDYYCGTVFKLDAGGHEIVLYNFHCGKDGQGPAAGLIRDSAGNLYGTTSLGGDLKAECGVQGEGCGTVFKLDTSDRKTILHSFKGGADFGIPEAGLVMDRQGNLYGTTYGNGADNPGTVYKVTQAGEEKVLYTFKDGNDGCNPMSTLAMDAEGNLYGTTSGNSGCNFGTVFKLARNGKETVLWDFQGAPDGQHPQAGVVMDPVGNLYGTTQIGGNASCTNGGGNGCGTVFKLDKGGHETVLYEFTGGSDGGFPTAGLLLDAKGNLYGTTPYGGYSNYCLYQSCGVVFKMTR